MTDPKAYGFRPDYVRQAKRRIRELVNQLVIDRPDAAFLKPIATTMLTSALNDFVRNYQHDASEGWASPEERRQAMKQGIETMQAWDAQVQK